MSEEQQPSQVGSTVLARIGERFNSLKRQNSAAAFRYLQEALATYANELVPAIIPLKDWITAVEELEKFMGVYSHGRRISQRIPGPLAERAGDRRSCCGLLRRSRTIVSPERQN